MMAIARAVRRRQMNFAEMYSFATSSGQPEWRVVPRRSYGGSSDLEDAREKTYNDDDTNDDDLL